MGNIKAYRRLIGGVVRFLSDGRSGRGRKRRLQNDERRTKSEWLGGARFLGEAHTWRAGEWPWAARVRGTDRFWGLIRCRLEFDKPDTVAR